MPNIPNPAVTGDTYLLDRQVELSIQRDLTFWFIEQDPKDIVLSTRIESRTASGGKVTVAGPVRPSVRVKLVATGSPGVQRANNGTERKYDFTLIALYDATVKPSDHWQDIYGNRYEIIEVLPYNGYEVRALVISHGKDPHAV